MSNSLTEWKPVHGIDLQSVDGKLILTDNKVRDWHLLRLLDPSLTYRRVTLRVRFEPLADCNTNFYVNGWGGVDLAIVGKDGSILKSQAIDLSVEKTDQTYDLTIVYNSSDPSISIGTAADKGYYLGFGLKQFAIHSISYTSEALSQYGGQADRLSLVDVGAAGGLQAKWLPFLDRLDVTLIEPSSVEAARLRRSFPGFRVIECALYDQPGMHELKITKFPECSSLLEPNMEELSRYRAAALFEVVERLDIACERYETLHARGAVPVPDVIKIDVQGAEHQVLRGFGDLLADCIGIEIESHFYEIYKGQSLLGEMVQFLAGYDLRLRRIEPQFNFDADIVEVNAFFSKPRAALSAARISKLDLIEKVWKLRVRDDVLPALMKATRRRSNEDAPST